MVFHLSGFCTFVPICWNCRIRHSIKIFFVYDSFLCCFFFSNTSRWKIYSDFNTHLRYKGKTLIFSKIYISPNNFSYIFNTHPQSLFLRGLRKTSTLTRSENLLKCMASDRRVYFSSFAYVFVNGIGKNFSLFFNFFLSFSIFSRTIKRANTSSKIRTCTYKIIRSRSNMCAHSFFVLRVLHVLIDGTLYANRCICVFFGREKCVKTQKKIKRDKRLSILSRKISFLFENNMDSLIRSYELFHFFLFV